MPIADRKLHVFLCHASQDKPVVRELYQRLLAEGWIDPWLDEEELLPGQEWDMEIEKAVEAADVVIVFLSNSSVKKEGYIQKEIRVAINIALEKPEETIYIIPLRLDSCFIPRTLKSLHYIDYFPDDRKEYSLKRLVQSLKIRANFHEGNSTSPLTKGDIASRDTENREYPYFEYGKTFFERGASDFHYLETSNLEHKSYLFNPYTFATAHGSNELGSISVAFIYISEKAAYGFLQIQQRNELEFLDGAGRPFKQIRVSILEQEIAKSAFEKNEPLIFYLLYGTKKNGYKLRDFRYPPITVAPPYLTDGSLIQFSKQNYFPREIIWDNYNKDDEYLIKLIAVAHLMMQKKKLNIIFSKNILPLEEQLLFIQTVQRLVFERIGIFEYSTDSDLSREVDMLLSKEQVYGKYYGVDWTDLGKDLDMSLLDQIAVYKLSLADAFISYILLTSPNLLRLTKREYSIISNLVKDFVDYKRLINIYAHWKMDLDVKKEIAGILLEKMQKEYELPKPIDLNKVTENTFEQCIKSDIRDENHLRKIFTCIFDSSPLFDELIRKTPILEKVFLGELDKDSAFAVYSALFFKQTLNPTDLILIENFFRFLTVENLLDVFEKSEEKEFSLFKKIADEIIVRQPHSGNGKIIQFFLDGIQRSSISPQALLSEMEINNIKLYLNSVSRKISYQSEGDMDDYEKLMKILNDESYSSPSNVQPVQRKNLSVNSQLLEGKYSKTQSSKTPAEISDVFWGQLMKKFYIVLAIILFIMILLSIILSGWISNWFKLLAR